jgi:hypothetical protein
VELPRRFSGTQARKGIFIKILKGENAMTDVTVVVIEKHDHLPTEWAN